MKQLLGLTEFKEMVAVQEKQIRGKETLNLCLCPVMTAADFKPRAQQGFSNITQLKGCAFGNEILVIDIMSFVGSAADELTEHWCRVTGQLC